MKYGIIIRNITDLRVKPDFLSERKSQLLFNEPVRIDKHKDKYYHVFQPDGYSGWVYDKAVGIFARRKIEDYMSAMNYRVCVKTASVNSLEQNSLRLPVFLFYGTKLAVSGRSAGNIFVREINGAAFSVVANRLDSISRSLKPQPLMIIKEVRKFLGVPYLWGGIGPCGFDCSGFVRTVFRTFNIELPRDSSEQSKVGREISFLDIKPADLLFFKGHVALAINKEEFVHASLSEGGVALGSFNSDSDYFRKDLLETFLSARRILP